MRVGVVDAAAVVVAATAAVITVRVIVVVIVVAAVIGVVVVVDATVEDCSTFAPWTMTVQGGSPLLLPPSFS